MRLKLPAAAAALVLALAGPARAQGDNLVSLGKIRKSLEPSAAAPKELAGLIKSRQGEFFDLMLSAVEPDPAALAAARPLIAALPPAEKKGLTELFDAMTAAAPEKRAAFSAAHAAVLAAEVKSLEPKIDPAAAAAAAKAVRAKAADAGAPWIVARAEVAAALYGLREDASAAQPALAAACAELERTGDRFHLAIADAVVAKAFADQADVPHAVERRTAATALFAEIGATPTGGRLGLTIASADLGLAGSLLAQGAVDPAIEAASRSRAVFKTAGDTVKELRTFVIVADARLDQGANALAVDLVAPVLERILKMDRADGFVDSCSVAGRALRRGGRGPQAARFLQQGVLRAEQLGASAGEAAGLRFLHGLALIASHQNEAAAAAFTAAADVAKTGGAPAVARAADVGRAVMQLATGKEPEARKTFAEALAATLEGPTLDKISAASAKLAFGEALIGAGKTADGVLLLSEAAAAADELGISVTKLPGGADSASTLPGDAMAERVIASITSSTTIGEWKSFEPIYTALERSHFDAIQRFLVEGGGASELDAAASRSDRRMARISRAFAPGRTPPSEKECAAAVEDRRALRAIAQKESPSYAARRFPQVAPLRRVRDAICAVKGAVAGAVVGPEGSYAFAFGRDSFTFPGIPKDKNLKDLLANFSKAANDPASSIESFLSASGPLWDALIKPILPELENKTRVVFFTDPILDDVPLEALAPPESKGASWEKIPYLATRIGVGRLVTGSLAPVPQQGRAQWIRRTALDGVAAGKAGDLLGLGRIFDEALAEPGLKTERAALFTAAERAKPAAAAGAAAGGGVLALGPGVPLRLAELPPDRMPDVVCLYDAPKPDREIADPVRWLLGRGARAVYAPRGKADPAMIDAMLQRAMASVRIGIGPVEAMADAQRQVFSDGLKQFSKAPSPAWRHPAAWSQLRLWTVAP